MHELINFDLSCPVPENTTLSVSGSMMLNDFNKTCHGVVLWMDYQLTDELVSTTGLLKVRCVPGIHVAQGMFKVKLVTPCSMSLILQMV